MKEPIYSISYGKAFNMPLMKITDLQRHYEMASGVVKALDGITIDIEEGERIVLLGPSGFRQNNTTELCSSLR